MASAVSNSGGLGLIGAGSMHPENLRNHIRKARIATQQPFGVNVPLLYPQIEEIMDIIIEERVEIVFTSAGSPKKWTKKLQEHGIKVAHVVSSSTFAKKCEIAGVDAIVAEGFEAGGHNGREETTTIALIPEIRKVTNLPIIAAGGIATGAAMFAAMALGADGVQIGTRYAASVESSAHAEFKQKILEIGEGDTKLALKRVAPTRLVKNHFFDTINEMEQAGASSEELRNYLGRGRAKRGMFEGDLTEGELEIGQVAAHIDRILPAEEITKQIMEEFDTLKNNIQTLERFSF